MIKPKAHSKFKYALLLSASLISFFVIASTPSKAAQASPEEIKNSVTKPKPGVTVYLPEYFKEYSPTNAAQMVAQVPGFSIDSGAEIRGLAGSEGNVLIDGSRPSLKGQDLYSYLSSIPLSQVKSIEVLEGAGLGNLGGAHTILVNVIRNESAKPSGSIEVDISSRGDIVRPKIEAAYNWQIGDFKYAATAAFGTYQKERRVGLEYLQDKNKNLIEHGPNNEIQDYRGAELGLNIDGKIKDVKTGFSFSYNKNEFDRDWNYLAYAPSGLVPIREDLGHDQNNSDSYSLGANFEKKLGKFDAKLELSAKKSKESGAFSFGRIIPSRPKDFGLFAPYSSSFEAVAQTSFSRKFDKHSFSFGGETGYNKLDSKSNFYAGDGINYQLVADSFSNTIVSETRSEAFIADNYTISPKLSIDGKLRAEWSRISQSGDKVRERSFVYLKPRIALTYKPQDDIKIKASFERKLGQLDFNDFAFQASLIEGNNTAANDHLQPYKSDEFNLVFEKNWGKKGNFTVSLGSYQIHDAIALVPVYENNVIVGETVGNVDDAKKWTFGVSTKIPLDSVLEGLEYNIDYRYAKSEILDPFTKITREYFSNGDLNFETSLVWNLEKKKQEYGVFFFRGERNSDYRYDSQYLWPSLNYYGIWANFKNIKDYEITLEIQVPNGFTVKRYRTQYEISRLDGAIASTQYKERDIGPRLELTIKRMI